MRAASLIIASAASLIGLIFPFILAAHATGLNQSVLLVMMFGIAGAFVHGVGFQPKGAFFAALIAPIFTWPLILSSCALLVAMR
jgi:predicted membrane protein